MEIAGLCSGLRAIALFAAVVLLAPLPRRKKVIHFAVGFLALMAVNVGRIVHLFTLGEARSPSFALYHEWIWPSAIVGAILLYRLALLLGARNKGRAPAGPPPSLEVAHG